VRERASRGAFAEGLALVEDMASAGIEPRLRTYAPLLQGERRLILRHCAASLPVSLQLKRAPARSVRATDCISAPFTNMACSAALRLGPLLLRSEPPPHPALPLPPSPAPAGLCAAADMPLAWRVWSHLRAHGVVPTADLYVALLCGASASGGLWGMVASGAAGALLAELSYEAFELEEGLVDQLKEVRRRFTSS
jgi:hypothetical protein